jgi:23S rRNA pseudouridine2605 synthase
MPLVVAAEKCTLPLYQIKVMSDKPKKSDSSGKKPSIHSKRKTKPDGTKEPRMRKRTGTDFKPERSFSRNSEVKPRGSRFGSRDENRSESGPSRTGNSYRDSRPSNRDARAPFRADGDRPQRRSFEDRDKREDQGERKNFDFRKNVSRSTQNEDRPARRNSIDSDSRQKRSFNKDISFKPKESRDYDRSERPSRGGRDEKSSFPRKEGFSPRRSAESSEEGKKRFDKKDVDFNKRPSQSGSRDAQRPFRHDRNDRNAESGSSFGVRSSRGSQDRSSDQSSRGKSRDGDFKKGITRRNSIKEENPMFKVTRAKGKERELVWGDTGEETSSAPVRKYYRDEKVVRLNRYIANAGICSRREADTLIQAGTITINGKVVTELGTKVNPDDIVLYGGQKLSREKLVYVLLNKPKDYVTTMRDPQGRKTVDQLVRGACRERIVPVGRLDRDTSGLLLMTNDGDMAKKLTHPKHGVVKLYHVHTDKKVSPDHIRQLMEGITLEDGPAKADQAAFVGDTQREIGLEIHIGRNRIVRRMFESLGYKVVKLDRVIFAGLTKKDLPRGRWRYLTEMELNKLKMVQ